MVPVLFGLGHRVSGARFILSLDCEGKWGVADHLGAFENRALTDERLRSAYGSIVALLDEFDLPATFAFVGAFTQSQRGFTRVADKLKELGPKPPYLRQVLDAIAGNGGDGWHGRDLVELVRSAGTSHEIALHGVTHVPWDAVDRTFARAELDLFGELEGPIRDARTFIYPRNRVAHVDVLKEHGFAGFRTARARRTRLGSLAAELNLLERPQPPATGDGIVPIPSGYFVNWRHGGRKLVPPAITAKRAALLLERAAEAEAVVHYWLHPENIATAPDTLQVLRSIVAAAARMRDAGRCDVLTQIEYCRRVASRQRDTN